MILLDEGGEICKVVQRAGGEYQLALPLEQHAVFHDDGGWLAVPLDVSHLSLYQREAAAKPHEAVGASLFNEADVEEQSLLVVLLDDHCFALV